MYDLWESLQAQNHPLYGPSEMMRADIRGAHFLCYGATFDQELWQVLP